MQSFKSTGDPHIDLFGAVVRRAVADAQGRGPWEGKGHREIMQADAQEFLDWICPSWRKLA